MFSVTGLVLVIGLSLRDAAVIPEVPTDAERGNYGIVLKETNVSIIIVITLGSIILHNVLTNCT